MSDWQNAYIQADRRIREHRPMVHHITNYVVMNLTANVTLAMGASPVMAHDTEEVQELAAMASALVINIGTLSPHWVKAMLSAGRKARELGIPVVLDPVGAGATALRTRVSRQILEEVKPSVIRGNQAEVAILGGASARIRGVDSLERGEVPLGSYRDLALSTGAVVAVTGATDWITDGRRTIRVDNGHPMMSNVTGTGCSASTAVAVFCAAGLSPLEGAALGLSVFGACGELAAARSAGPGTFQAALLDALFNSPDLDLGSRLKIADVN